MELGLRSRGDSWLYTKGLVWKKPQAGEKPDSGLESVREGRHLKRPNEGKPSGTRRKGQRTLVRSLVSLEFSDSLRDTPDRGLQSRHGITCNYMSPWREALVIVKSARV
jgi:hypothetical protein